MSDTKNARKHERFDSLNLLEYVLVDEHGNPIGGGMGRTLNISKGGILLETTQEFERGQRLWVLIGVEEEMVEVEGEVVHVAESEIKDRYKAGIDFRNLNKKSTKVLETYLDQFQRRRR